MTKDSEAPYQVGHGKPPISTRWRSGQSGNPKGRKKAIKTVAQGIHEALMQKVTIEENGRRVGLTLQEVILRKLAYAAARGDMPAIKTLFALQDKYQDSAETKLDPNELDPNDRAIIEAYLENLKDRADTAHAPGAEKQLPEESEDLGEVTTGLPRKREVE